MAIARPRVSALDGDPSPPFQLTAHPSVFWDGPPYREALETLRRAVRENRGVLLLTGDVGCGKTILANVLAESLEREGVVVGALRHPHVDAFEFLQAIAHSLGLTTPFDSRTACLSVLREFVDAARAASRPTLFIVDEAQSRHVRCSPRSPGLDCAIVTALA